MNFEAFKKHHGEDAAEEAFILGVTQGIKQALEWRPIEEAPEFKDVLIKEITGHVYIAERQGNRWWQSVESVDIRVRPVKWMPTPE